MRAAVGRGSAFAVLAIVVLAWLRSPLPPPAAAGASPRAFLPVALVRGRGEHFQPPAPPPTTEAAPTSTAGSTASATETPDGQRTPGPTRSAEPSVPVPTASPGSTEAPPPGTTSSVGGMALAVAVSGDRAALGQGAAVVMLDVSDPATPRAIGRSPTLGGVVRDVWYDGRTLLVAAGGAGIVALDASDPAAPVPTGRLDVGGHARRIAAAGGRAYVLSGPAMEDSRLSIVDAADPSALRLLGGLGLAYAEARPAVVGTTVYVAIHSGALAALDVSDPSRPRRVGAASFDGPVLGLAVDGRHAYAMGTNLTVVDVGNAADPRVVGTAEWANALDVAAGDGYAFGANATGLVVFDVRRPNQPGPAGGAGLLSPSSGGLALASRHVHVTGASGEFGDGGMQILDVRTAARPSAVGRYDAPGYALDVAGLPGGAVYADGEGVWTIALGAPGGAPTALSAVPLPTAGSSVRPSSVVVEGSRAYVTSARENRAGWLQILDLSSPARPRQVGVLELAGGARDAALVGGVALVLVDEKDAAPRMEVVDVSDPVRPRSLAPVPVAAVGRRPRIVASAGQAFVLPAGAGVQVFDVSNPRRPLPVGEVALPDRAYDAALLEGLLVVSDVRRGLHVLQLAGPALPSVLGATAGTEPVDDPDAGGTRPSLACDAGRCVMGDARGRLEMFDLLVPARPARRGHLSTPGQAVAVAVHGGRLLVADGGAGLVVHDLDAP